jgi:hypothetical protein
MKLAFTVESGPVAGQVATDIHTLVIAGWAGRDMAAIEHHIEELAALGVSRPSAVPLFYRVAANQLTQAEKIQVVGPHSSGEVEVFLFRVGGELYVSLVSDHTDRKLEAASVALSKQLCVKPVARKAWRFAEVAAYWDELVIRSRIVENGVTVAYQEGAVASLRSPLDLAERYTGSAGGLPEGVGMSCGTVPAIGGIRPADDFTMELFDPRTGRSISHHYALDVLPEIA